MLLRLLFWLFYVAVEYKIQDFGSVRYFLAPKIDDEETTATQDE